MLNKKIHQDALARREALQVEPETQKQLKALLHDALGEKIFDLPPHAWEYGLTLGVSREHAGDVFSCLRHDPRFSFDMLLDVTAVDWLDSRTPRFDVVYQLLSLSKLHRLCIKIQVSEENPEVDSLRPIWESANFLEREVYDMFGINFAGHGDLRRILMYDEFVGHPLRKDYPLRGKQPRLTLRVPELRNTADDLKREELVSLPVRQRITN